jgi:hypothetical protein
MFKRLIEEISKCDTIELCQLYDTFIKIKDSYARSRQLHPSVQEYQKLYEDASNIEKVIQDTIMERYLAYKDEEDKK